MTQTIADLINDMRNLRAGLTDGSARNAADEPATGDVDAAIAALDGAIALLSGDEAAEAPAVQEPEVPPYAIVEAKPGAPDDLRNIRGISSATAYALTNLGITRYAHIAGLTARDVRQLKSDLGYRCTIGRDNWIEQAAMLEQGQTTSFSRRGGPATLGASVAEASQPETASDTLDVSGNVAPLADVAPTDTVAEQDEFEAPDDEPSELIASSGLDAADHDVASNSDVTADVADSASQDEEAMSTDSAAADVPEPGPDEDTAASDLPIEMYEAPDIEPQKEAEDTETDARAADDDDQPMNGESAAMAAGLGALIAGGLAHHDARPDVQDVDEADAAPAEVPYVAHVSGEDTTTPDALTNEKGASTPDPSHQLNDEDDVFALLPEPVAVLPSIMKAAPVLRSPEHAPTEADWPAPASSEPEIAHPVVNAEDQTTEPDLPVETIAMSEASDTHSSESIAPAATGLGALLAAVEPKTEADQTSPPPRADDSAAPFAPIIRDTSNPPLTGAVDTSAVSIHVSEDPTVAPLDSNESVSEPSAADLMETQDDTLPSDLRSELEAQFAPIIQTSDALSHAPPQNGHSPEAASPPRPAVADRLGAARATIDPLPEPFSPHKTAVDEAEIVIVRDGKSDTPVPQVPELTDRDSNTGLVGRISRMFARKS